MNTTKAQARLLRTLRDNTDLFIKHNKYGQYQEYLLEGAVIAPQPLDKYRSNGYYSEGAGGQSYQVMSANGTNGPDRFRLVSVAAGFATL